MRNELVPFLIRHCLAGIAAGWTTVGLMLWTDLAGIGTLAAASDLWPIPHLMLFAFFGLIFGSVAMGAAIMALGDRHDAQPRAGARRFRPPVSLSLAWVRPASIAARRGGSDPRGRTTGGL